VDSDALTALEFAAIAQRLEGVAATPRGQELARALAPSSAPAEVARRQALTAEAVALLEESDEPPLHGIHDVREAAAHAARGGVLTAAALARVASTVAGGLRVRAAAETPLFSELAAAIEPGLGSLAEQISHCVEEDGSDLRDNASPRLRKLRRELRDGRQRVADELRRLARSPALAQHLQEDFVALRGGRPVLAVKASSRSSVKGIVHDASGSGQTLFVEPSELVEDNNSLRSAQVQAAAEKYFEASKLHVILVGDPDLVREQVGGLGLGEVQLRSPPTAPAQANGRGGAQ